MKRTGGKAAAAPAAKKTKQGEANEGSAASPVTAERGFPRKVAALCLDYFEEQDKREAKVVEHSSPAELAAAFAEGGVDISLKDGTACTEAQLLEAVKLTLQYSVRTGHPWFLNQLYGLADGYGTAGELVTTVTNTNVHTYEVSPVFTVIEREVVARIARQIGPNFEKEHDGLFVPGGSISNMYAIHLARFRADPEFKRRGALGGPRLVGYTSSESHYSYLKSFSLLGLGMDNLIKVGTTVDGQLDPKLLEQAVKKTLKEGGKPFFVGSTAGTTVQGAFDDFVAMNAACKKYSMWHHIDGCWGGGVMFSRDYRHLMAGADDADSLAWNPHKMMGMPLQCSIFVTRYDNILATCNGTRAEYLFQPDKQHADMDQGDKTIQCGRKPDAYKMWLAFKAHGDAGMADIADKSGQICRYMVAKLKADDRFFFAREPQFANIGFWYIPARLRAKKINPRELKKGTKDWKDMHNVAVQIKASMQDCGEALIGFQPFQNLPNYFRIVFPSAGLLKESDIDTIIEAIHRHGNDL